VNLIYLRGKHTFAVFFLQSVAKVPACTEFAPITHGVILAQGADTRQGVTRSGHGEVVVAAALARVAKAARG